ncbi:unnamed protein product, partial [Polarella glacialis]
MSSWFSALAEAALGGAAPEGAGTKFRLGEIVDYFSATQASWIPAKVVAVNANGTFDLDCKPGVPPEKIRRCATDSGVAGSAPLLFQTGDLVEYLSATQNEWIPATVVSVNPSGTYHLDCKPEVVPARVRARSQSDGPSEFLPGSQAFAGPAKVKASPVAELEAPVQLLKVQRSGSKWNYEVCPEGAQALERHGSRRISVVSVCGLYRTGKSFLLNLLLERVQKGLPPFQVGGTTKACTEGLWLWGSADPEDEQSPLLAFMDCEGFGSTDSDRTRDAQLLTLCALLSSVLVLNTKGTLNEGIFNSLALTCRFAEHMEERGQEANRPALLWVLRDFVLELRDAAGNQMSPDEYLEQALHAAPLALAGGTLDQARAGPAQEVRQSLLQFFSHRNCTTLVQPAIEEAQLQNLNELPYKSLRGEFRAGVEAMRTQLVATCHLNPKTVGGQPLGCTTFVALMRQLVGAMNNSKQLSVKGAWDAVQHTTCGKLGDELRAVASQVLKALAAGQKLPDGAQLPMTDEALRAFFRDQRHKLKFQWDEQAVGDEEVRKEYWQELKEALAREEMLARQQNSRLADQQLAAALKLWQEWLDDALGTSEEGERIAADLGLLMERMPATPLTRAAR